MPVAFTSAATIRTTPQQLQPTATNFVPANAANPMPAYQPQQYQPHQSMNAKLISEVAKQYENDHKYDGSGSLDAKLDIFFDICKRNDVPAELHMKAFPIMLKGLALDQYYNSELSQYTFQNACNSLCDFFQGPEFERRSLKNWKKKKHLGQCYKAKPREIDICGPPVDD